MRSSALLTLHILPLLGVVSLLIDNDVHGPSGKARNNNFIHSQVLMELESASATATATTTGLMQQKYPWYHTSQEIRSETKRLAAACGGQLSFRSVSESGVQIDVARVRDPNAKPSNRVFIMFGEHSRELISPESGLHFLKVLCGETPASNGADTSLVKKALQDSEFEMVLNGNPGSRPNVESGDFCLRLNPNGVDLNRNWDEKWANDNPMGMNPGSHPFSEAETRIFRRLVTEYHPTTFLSVHSGTRGLYMPWAYDTEHLASKNQPAMMEILRDLDAGHCQCPYGAAGKEVGYACPGTCLDWVYDQLDTPFSFAFEIYTSPSNDAGLQSRWEEKLMSGGQQLLQTGNHLGHPHFLDLFQHHASDFVQVEARSTSQPVVAQSDDCFDHFNPDTEELYNATVQNWALAYLDMSRMIAAKLMNQSEAAKE